LSNFKTRSQYVTLRIYNILGQEVATLVDEKQLPGKHTVHWNGKDDKGGDVTSAAYFYRLIADGKTLVRKMLMVR